MRFTLGCELSYEVQAPTTLILNIEAMQAGRQFIAREQFGISPGVPSETHAAAESGNRYRRLVVEPGSYVIRYDALVEAAAKLADPADIPRVPIGDLPLETLPYLYPSRYCQSDLLARFAGRQFGGTASGHEQVEAICNWIHDHVDYMAGTSDAMTSAHDTFSSRAGVCRDFAHLGITFCRAVGIPARFVSAYGWQLYPQDFHAVFEAYLGDGWYLFDATRLCPLDGIVRIGIGRDAADTAFATFYGAMISAPKAVWIEPAAEAEGDLSKPWTVEAVSIAKA